MGRRQLAELNLLDRFLFNEAMEDPENMKTVLDIIFEELRVKRNSVYRR